MLAIDTNIIIRYLTGDHPEQSRKSRELIEGNDIFVCTTVLLEAEWVLRSGYGYESDRVCAAFRAFSGLGRVHLEDAALIAKAVNWLEQGMDFADALHLAKAEGREAFISFDRHLTRAAEPLSGMEVRAP